MDKYVYIDIEKGDVDMQNPVVIRFRGVRFGRNAESEIFDRKCNPIRPLERFAEKFLGITNRELEKYPPQEKVKEEFIRFINGAHVICNDVEFCERALGIKLTDSRTTADVRRANGTCYFDKRYIDVIEAAEQGELSLADIQRVSESSFRDACDIADDLVFFKILEKDGKIYRISNK